MLGDKYIDETKGEVFEMPMTLHKLTEFYGEVKEKRVPIYTIKAKDMYKFFSIVKKFADKVNVYVDGDIILLEAEAKGDEKFVEIRELNTDKVIE